MPYYAYMGGFCGYCGADLGLIDQAGGRNRHYCNDAHKQAAYRKRREGDKHNAVLLRNVELSDYWQEHEIIGAILSKLQDILINHGKDAARAATEAVILARQLERDSGTSERADLLEQTMMLGEACGFEALRLEDTSIEPGLDAWSAFVTSADRRRRLAGLGGEATRF
jgi:hypothetical protein